MFLRTNSNGQANNTIDREALTFHTPCQADKLPEMLNKMYQKISQIIRYKQAPHHDHRTRKTDPQHKVLHQDRQSSCLHRNPHVNRKEWHHSESIFLTRRLKLRAFLCVLL